MILINKTTSKIAKIAILNIVIFFNLNLFCLELKLNIGKDPKFISLSKEFLQELKNFFNINTFIETGTCLGFTTAIAAEVYANIHSIELSKELYNKSSENLSKFKNIKLYLGDSGVLLKSIITKNMGKILLWLDGHYSGIYVGGYHTAMGSINTPIINELQCIKESGVNNSVILIDDLRIFDKRLKDLSHPVLGGYPDIVEVCNIIKNINGNYDIVLMGDILLAYVKNKDITVSNTLRACTISRISNNFKEIIKHEKFISQATGIERDNIEYLYKHFCQSYNPAYKNYGIGDYYALWYSLLLINDKKYHEADQILEDLERKYFEEERIKHYRKICKKKQVRYLTYFNQI